MKNNTIAIGIFIIILLALSWLYFGKSLVQDSNVTISNQVTVDTNTTMLDLSNKNLTSLPSEIGNLTGVEEFNVSNNQLTGALPAEIRKMTGLRILDASNNNLTGIPAEVGQLSHLESLDLSNNNIDTFPNELEMLKDSLKTLNIAGNAFSADKIAQMQLLLPNTEIIVE